ncbi:Gfo/Idh/MocA family protein [Paraburkholderia sp. GAS334]|uniref:Gfo/Idh/MocA family protein n=1 Tax=Paraburkholderia sp. GAS334 TaxID=3035131 RepID=UPI003D1D3E1A
MTINAISGGTRPIRVGIIGAGNWAHYGHLRVLTLLPEFEITAIQSRRREVAEAAATRFNISHVLETVEQVAGHPDVDLVVVLTPAPQHEAGVSAALAAGKDVYAEWPLSTSTALSKSFIDLAEKSGKRHLVGLQRRLSATNRYLRDQIANGYIGNLRSVRMHVSMNYFQAKLPKSLAWTAPPENFSSMMAIYAGHFLDALFSIVGQPASLSALTLNQFSEITIIETGEKIQTTNPDEVVATGQLVSGGVFTVHLEGGKRNGSGVQIDITGDEGDLTITNSSAFGDVGEDYVIKGAHGNRLPLDVLQVPGNYNWLPPSELPSAVLELANLYVAYARDIAAGTRIAPTFEDAVRMHTIIDLIEHSSKTGSRVDVPKAPA